MKRCAIVWGIVVTLVAGTTVAAENPDLVVLENPSLRLDIGRAPVPHIERLVHKASGRQLVASSEESSIFSIVAHDAGGGRKTIDSALAGTSSIQVDTVGGRRRVVARYTDFPQSTLIGVVTITDDGAGALTRWSLQLEGIARERIETVRFPQLVSVPTLGDGSDDVLVLPALPGTLIENPAKNWRDGQRVTLSYPGSMSAQFVAYQDHEAGIYLAAMDSTGYPQSLSVSKRADAMVLWHEFHIVADANDEQGNNTHATTSGRARMMWRWVLLREHGTTRPIDTSNGPSSSHGVPAHSRNEPTCRNGGRMDQLFMCSKHAPTTVHAPAMVRTIHSC